MALTVPALFESYRTRASTQSMRLVVLSNGTNTYYLSEHRITIGSNTFSPVISDIADITQSIDIYSRIGAVSSIDIVCRNTPDEKDGTRLSDSLGAIINYTCDIYLLNGGKPTALTDLLKVFSGKLSKRPAYTADQIVFTIEHKQSQIHKLFPPTVAADEYTTVRQGKQADRLPIVYNDIVLDQYHNGSGFVEGIQVDEGTFIIADHESSAISRVWAWCPAIEMWIELDSGSYTVDTSDADGRTRVTIDDVKDVNANVYVRPSGLHSVTDWPSGGGYANNYINNPELVLDRSGNTVAQMVKAPSTLAHSIEYRFPSLFVGGDNTHNPIGEIAAGGAYIVMRCTPVSGRTYDQTATGWQVSTDAGYTSYVGALNQASMTSTLVGTGSGVDFTWETDVLWDLGGSSNLRFDLRVTITDTPADGTPILNIYEVFLKIPCNLNFMVTRLAAEISGAVAPSWLNSRNGYATGDLIEHTCYQVEHICREYLGVATGDIDTTSFDACYNADIQSRLAILTTEQRNSAEIIKEMCENDTFMFDSDDVGQVRLIRLDQASPTTNETIPFYDLIDFPQVFRTDISKIINDLAVTGDYNYSTGQFRTSDTAGSATTSTYGTLKGQSILRYAKQIANLTNILMSGIYDADHRGIMIKTKLWKYAHLTKGDWIELDATTNDTMFLLDGASWSGEQFMIIEKTLGRDNVTFTAIQL